MSEHVKALPAQGTTNESAAAGSPLLRAFPGGIFWS